MILRIGAYVLDMEECEGLNGMKLLTFFAFYQNSSEEHCLFGLIGMNLISITKHITTILLMRYCASPFLFDIEM